MSGRGRGGGGEKKEKEKKKKKKKKIIINFCQFMYLGLTSYSFCLLFVFF